MVVSVSTRFSRRFIAGLLVATCSIGATAPAFSAPHNANGRSGGVARSGSEGGAVGVGGLAGGGLVTKSGAETSSNSNHADAKAHSRGAIGFGQVTAGSVSGVGLRTDARATAHGDRHGLTAHAVAEVSGIAAAVQGNSAVVAAAHNKSEATATKAGKTVFATAASDAGGMALAVSGKNSITIASVPNENVKTVDTRRMDYTLAWNADNVFSLAVTTPKSAYAATGTVSNTGVLTSGNLAAIIRNATFAEAYADQTTAWASAYASAFGVTTTSQGFVAAGINSSAFAAVTYVPPSDRAPSQCSVDRTWKQLPDLSRRKLINECGTWRPTNKPTLTAQK
jgi:hypothetical protein